MTLVIKTFFLLDIKDNRMEGSVDAFVLAEVKLL